MSRTGEPTFSYADPIAVRCYNLLRRLRLRVADAMTKKNKVVETEIFDGAGASAGLVIIRKPRSASGYYGVVRNGNKGWQARVYKPAKQCWDDVGTYETPREAAIQAAIAQNEVKNGFRSLYSPLKPRTGAPLTSCPPCPLRAAIFAERGRARRSRMSGGPQRTSICLSVPRARLGQRIGASPARSFACRLCL